MIGLLLAAAIASCTQPVELLGDEGLRADLGRRLASHGVEVGPGADSCPALQVRVERQGDAIVLGREDAAGRMERRTVHEPGLAAALIESWNAADLAAPLLEFPMPDRAAPAPLPQGGMLALGIAAELGYSDAGTWERGAAARLGAGNGRFLAELTLRYAAEDRPDTSPALVEHWLADMLVGARLPLDFGPLTLAPGIAVGIGLDGSARAACSTGCTRIIEDDAHATSLAARAEASLLAALALGRAFAVEFSLGGSASPFASSEPALPAYAGASGAEAFALAAPPRARLRAGLGLIWRPL